MEKDIIKGFNLSKFTKKNPHYFVEIT